MLFYAAPCYSNATYVIPCSANYSMVVLAGRALGPRLVGFVLRAGCLVWVPPSRPARGCLRTRRNDWDPAPELPANRVLRPKPEVSQVSVPNSNKPIIIRVVYSLGDPYRDPPY